MPRHHDPVGKPAAPPAPGPAAPGALDAADAAFGVLVTGPRPLALNPGRLAAGLPDRDVALGELRALLLHPATPPAARNKVWAELVRRARSGEPEWVIGLAGIAMPGLRRAAARLRAAWRADPHDLQSEVLAGFLTAMRALDLDDLDSVPLASRLCWAAWRAGQKLACADAAWASRRRDLGEAADGPVMPWGHPDFVLAAAVRGGVLTAAQADLIGRNRLEGVPLAQIAAESGISHGALCHRRRRAEARLVAAISQGILADAAPVRRRHVNNSTGSRICVSAGNFPDRPGAGRRPPLTPPAADRREASPRARPPAGPRTSPGPRPKETRLMSISPPPAASAIMPLMWSALAAHGPARTATISQVIGNTTAWIVGILAGVATLFLTVGGLRYLMAGGDPGEVERAKVALKSAAIGYGLAVLAPVIVTVLKSLVSG